MYIPSLRQVWRIILIGFGFALLIAGFALLFLPGPGLLVIFLGLAILAGQFFWARWTMQKVKQYLKTAAQFVRRTWSGKKERFK